MTTEHRKVISLSLTTKNPKTEIVLTAIMNVPRSQRSATIIEWLANYLEGKALETLPVADADENLDDLLARLDELDL